MGQKARDRRVVKLEKQIEKLQGKLSKVQKARKPAKGKKKIMAGAKTAEATAGVPEAVEAPAHEEPLEPPKSADLSAVSDFDAVIGAPEAVEVESPPLASGLEGGGAEDVSPTTEPLAPESPATEGAPKPPTRRRRVVPTDDLPE